MTAVMDRELIIKNREIAVMDSTGDSKTIWDSRNKDEVEAAKNTFDSLKKKGYLIYQVGKNGEKGVAMHKFDPDAEKMIAVPPVMGG